MHLRKFTLAVTILSGGSSAFAQLPKAEELLARKPIQAVSVSTPTAAELETCKVEAANYPKPASGAAPTGIIVKDGQGRILRQFIDTTGSGKPNLVYFYHNGTEAYREIDANGNGKPDQYRWLGVNGGKWGSDTNEDGSIDQWFVLSAEELSQEVFAAMQTKNAKRLEVLFPTEAELKSLNLPAVEIEKIRRSTTGAVKKMTEAATSLNVTDKSKWVHLECGLPTVVASDTFGGRDDFTKQTSAVVLFENGDGKTAGVFTLGEIVQLGKVWKLIDGPSPGAGNSTGTSSGDSAGIVVPPEARPILEQLAAVRPASAPADMARYHAERATLLEKIAAVTTGENQQPWLKQVIDAHAARVESAPADAAAMTVLRTWSANIEKDHRGTGAAGYAAFRTLTAEYTVKMAAADEKSVRDVQKWWRDQLDTFIVKYPTAEDTAEAMMRLGVGHEYVGRDGEAAAKATYEKLAVTFPNHPHAAKARGAVARLASDGKAFNLPQASMLDGKPFSANELAGKPTLVVYWGNLYRDPTGEARVVENIKALAELVKLYGDKGFRIVTISVDDEPARAVQALNAAGGLPGIHLHLPGGLDRSPLAVAYGIQFLPHAFLLAKDGTVVNRNAQVGPPLKDEIEKLLK